MSSNLARCLLVCLILLLGCEQPTDSGVQIASTEEGWRLVVEEEPFYVKGAGGKQYFPLLQASGGNAVRTWNAKRAQEILDRAHDHGLKVMLGLWVQHERHGFDYKDKAAVKAQFDQFKEIVTAFRNHPALLLWSVGNEVGFRYENLEVIEAVDEIAAMIKEHDPLHPVTTVTAGVREDEVSIIMNYGKHIDFISVNSYGDIGSVEEDLTKFGYDGPYLITEWGTNGHWEVDTTDMGAPVEPSTNEKEVMYYSRYNEHIVNKPRCMGSFVFMWGQKQERTHSWYGMFDENGKPYGTVEAMEQAWKGQPLEPSSARISGIRRDGRLFDPSQTLVGNIVASFEVEGDWTSDATISWELFAESQAKTTGGDPEDKPEPVSWLSQGFTPEQVLMLTPDTSGSFRLFVTIEQNGYLSSMNVPFNVIRKYQ